MLQRPRRLYSGDTVATISPSWGGAGDAALRWRYEQGIARLREVFGLQVVAMPHTLKGSDFVYAHPQQRAADLMAAFLNPDVKAIITTIGGDDAIRLLPYIDFSVIAQNPKIFIGYSDATIVHLFCHKAGLSSFYGPAILTDFAENIAIDAYTIEALEKTLFSTSIIGPIQPATEWTSEHLDWTIANKDRARKRQPNSPYELLQGTATVQGRLIGGCIEVLEFAKGTSIWPAAQHFEQAILFFETSEEKPTPSALMYMLRNYVAQGILQKVNGIIFGKPQDGMYYEEYKDVIRKVLNEANLTTLPVLYNLNFGHTEPKFLLPYGALAEIDCSARTLTILEAAVTW